MSSFETLDLIEPLRRAVASLGYQHPTPLQAAAIPPLLAGRDLLGCAQTGTGKTAAFALPLLQRLSAAPPESGRRPIRALVLAPTRELAAQIEEAIHDYGSFLSLRSLVIFGGVGQNPQVAALRRGVDVLVATPGRLLDLIQQGHVALGRVEVLVLDEADRMLDMGFIRDIRRILSHLPDRRQNLLFSATIPREIAELSRSMLRDPVRVEVTPQTMAVELIEQQLMMVHSADKRQLLADVLNDPEVRSAIVFTRTKHGANRVVTALDRAGISSAAIHGNKSQGARRRALDAFADGQIPVLVATDIASRGLDLEHVTHVINFDLPHEPESYVHRIGRTGRAGRSGVAISFCEPAQRGDLAAIERLTGARIPVVGNPGGTSRPSRASEPVRTTPSRRPEPARSAPRSAAAPPRRAVEAVPAVDSAPSRRRRRGGRSGYGALA